MVKKEEKLSDEHKLRLLERQYAKKHNMSSSDVQFSRYPSGKIKKEFWFYGLGWRSESFKRNYESYGKP